MTRRIIFILLVIIPLFALTQQTILADASLVVNTTADEDGTGTACSLREAITAANTDADYGGCVGSGAYGADTITFFSYMFNSGAKTITLTSNLPTITTSVNIIGPGANLLTISGNGLYRVFYIDGSLTASLSGITISQGYADMGSGIRLKAGSLTLSNSVVSNNTAFGTGGGIFQEGGTLTVSNSTFSGNTTSNSGGAILITDGALTMSNSTVSGNTAGFRGGGIFNSFRPMTIVNSTFVNNTAATNSGGGIWIMDSVGYFYYLLNSIVTDNVGGDCGGVTPNAYNSLIKDGSCGISSGVDGNLSGNPLLLPLSNNGGTTSTHALLRTSPAVEAGSNAYLSEATLGVDYNGDGDTSDTLTTDQRGNGWNRMVNSAVDLGAFESKYSTSFTGLVVDTASDSSLSDCGDLPDDCSLRGAIDLANSATDADTIMFNNTIFSSVQTITLTGNLPTITTSMSITGPGANLLSISGNNLYRPFEFNGSLTASLSGMTITQGKDNFGGGIRLKAGSLTVRNSTISNNVGSVQGGGILQEGGSLTVTGSIFSNNSSGNSGGGILAVEGTVTISNSTFVGNIAGFRGGGIFNGYRQMTIANSTFSGNTAANGSGGGIWITSSVGEPFALLNSIVTDNTGGDCGGVAPTTHNSLIKDGSCGISSGVNGNLSGDPLLSALADNGGAIQTMALASNSPAIDKGSNSYLSEASAGADFNGDGDTSDTLTTDQRGGGYNRAANSTVDMGAYESAPVNAAPTINYSSSNSIPLSWSRISWATGYEVQISTSNTFGTLLCGGAIPAAADVLSVTTCALPSGTYYWRVKAIPASGTSAWSNVVLFVIAGP